MVNATTLTSLVSSYPSRSQTHGKGRATLMLSILKSAVGGVTKTELLDRIDGSYIMLNEVLTFLREYGLISEEKDSESGMTYFLTTQTGLDLLQSTRYFKEIDEVKTAFEEQLLAAA